jgi:nucleoid DNA-binding protein
MTTIDLINKIAINHNITSGRAEMILSIIVEKIIENLKKDGEIAVTDFGTFKIQQKNPEQGSYLKLSEPVRLAKNVVTFEPDTVFLKKINFQ